MLVTKPQIVSVVVPQTRASQRDLHYLQRAVVVDARLWPAHDPSGMQARVIAVCNADEPLELSEMDEDRYVVILPAYPDSSQFLRKYSSRLETFSLVCYQWSPRIVVEPIVYSFKVWLDLCKVSLTSCNFQHLVSLLTQVGLILDHKMQVVLAVKNSAKVPHAINFAVRGLESDITVEVVRWDYHETTINVLEDPTLKKCSVPGDDPDGGTGVLGSIGNLDAGDGGIGNPGTGNICGSIESLDTGGVPGDCPDDRT